MNYWAKLAQIRQIYLTELEKYEQVGVRNVNYWAKLAHICHIYHTELEKYEQVESVMYTDLECKSCWREAKVFGKHVFRLAQNCLRKGLFYGKFAWSYNGLRADCSIILFVQWETDIGVDWFPVTAVLRDWRCFAGTQCSSAARGMHVMVMDGCWVLRWSVVGEVCRVPLQ